MKIDIKESFPIQTNDGTIFGTFLTDGKVLIKQGSFYRTYETPSLRIEHKNKRLFLINNGYVKNGQLIKDYVFDTPSSAICTLIGAQASGLKMFITTDNITLGEYLDSIENFNNEIIEQKEFDDNHTISTIDVKSDSEYIPEFKPSILQQSKNSNTNLFPRDSSKAKGMIVYSNYKCNIDSSHISFITKNGNPYMEAHHLIPLNAQKDFNVSLDVDANIVCLCPNCHRKLHYGINIIDDLKKLYNERIFLLKKSGINISFDVLLGYYNSFRND